MQNYICTVLLILLAPSRVFANDWWPTDCSSTCSTVQVACLSSAEMAKICGSGSVACSDPERCHLYLLSDSCSSIGLLPGTYPLDDLKNAVSNCHSAIDTNSTVDCCGVQHEVRHVACKINPTLCMEAREEKYDLQCLNTIITSKCTKVTSNKSVDWQKCENMCLNAAYGSVYYAWDNCMCGEVKQHPQSMRHADCCDCVQSVRSVTAPTSVYTVAPLCQTRFIKWKTDFSNPIFKENFIKGLATGLHGCSYYKGPAFDHCLCGPCQKLAATCKQTSSHPPLATWQPSSPQAGCNVACINKQMPAKWGCPSGDPLLTATPVPTRSTF